jgi:hypothetical protein
MSPRCDLIVWLREDETVQGFQFCYDKDDIEHALTWVEGWDTATCAWIPRGGNNIPEAERRFSCRTGHSIPIGCSTCSRKSASWCPWTS